MILRRNTAASVIIGPFVSDGDGITPCSWNIANGPDRVPGTSIYISKNGSDLVPLIDPDNQAIGQANGFAKLNLSSGDTTTTGRLIISVMVPGLLSVWHEILIVHENHYDAVISNTGSGTPSNIKSVDIVGGVPINSTDVTSAIIGRIDDGVTIDGAVNANVIQVEGVDATTYYGTLGGADISELLKTIGEQLSNEGIDNTERILAAIKSKMIYNTRGSSYGGSKMGFPL